ncbi:MAG: iron ABC transporter permease [Balneolales bacterium]|nr:iron ABC transporter permease [Balneolales bacterium]
MKTSDYIRKLPPWYFFAPAIFVGIAVTLPLVYLLVRALDGNLGQSAELLFRERNLTLLLNTLKLTAGVLVVTTFLGFPFAWLTSRTDIAGKRVITLLGVLPLAIPGYVLAYALLGIGGENGTLSQVFGLTVARPSGYWGALTAISLYTFPYLFLNLRTGLMGLDPSTEEAARSLGLSSFQVLYKVVLPQLKPAFYSGVLIISLYVIGDFGAVSLLRYETLSYALFIQYESAFDRVYAAWIALILLTLTCTILVAEYKLLKGLLFYRAGTGVSRKTRFVALGHWKWIAYSFVGLVTFCAIILPLITILFWMAQGVDPLVWEILGRSITSSVVASAPAALLAAFFALPLAYISVRYPSRTSNILQRFAYLGYATPPLALALAFIFFSLNIIPFIYQTIGLLVFAYSLHFLAEAMGPVRSALYQTPPRIEEAAQSLGVSKFMAFVKTTLPLLRGGIIAGISFVFLSAMKELPITFILAPIGFETLALNVWSFSGEAMFAEAAPFAISILFFSVIFVLLLFSREWKKYE